jgi:glycosyltransferase involved in cell wall biosynthesis
MRILTTSDFYPPFIGGAERQVSLICRNLAQRGHTISVASVWQTGSPEVVRDDAGVTIYRLKGLSTRMPWFFKDPQRRFHPPFPDVAMVLGLKRLIREIRPDVVHAVGWIAYSTAAALWGSSIPFVISTRDHGYTCPIRSFVYRNQVCSGPALLKCLGCSRQRYGWPKALAAVTGVFTGRSLLRQRVNAYHCASTYIARVMQRDLFGNLHTEGKPHTMIPNILEAYTAPDFTPEIAAQLPKTYILFVGALQASKGLDVLLQAYQQLVAAPPLVLIGTVWPDTPTVFPPNVIVLRDVVHPAVMFAWKHSLFGVTPSLMPETFGNVVAEAMGQAKAVIASNNGSLADLVRDGETGLLVPPGDVAALTQAMQWMLDNPETCQRFGLAGYEHSKTFASEHVVPQFESFYQRLSDKKFNGITSR